MPPLWSISGFLLLCLSAAGLREPGWAGKSVDSWLDAGYEDAAMALQQIGTPAVPYILAKLAREDPSSGSLRRYGELWGKIPPALRKFFPKPKPTNFNELRACSALLEIGPRAVPLLSIQLENPNPAVREACTHALGCFRERGNDIRRAFPALAKALHDSSPQVRTRATWALAREN